MFFQLDNEILQEHIFMLECCLMMRLMYIHSNA